MAFPIAGPPGGLVQPQQPCSLCCLVLEHSELQIPELALIEISNRFSDCDCIEHGGGGNTSLPLSAHPIAQTSDLQGL